MPIFWMWMFAAAQFLASYVPLFSKLQYSRHFRYYKRVTEETYHVFVGPRAYHTSIDRKGDAAALLDDLSKALVAEEQESDSARRRALLLVGKAGIGKSQLAIDVARKLDCRLMSPKPDTLEDLLASVWLKWSKKDGLLLFLDDLNHLVKDVGDRQVLQQIITKFMTQRGSVLATCRAEAYQQLETANLGESTFQIVNIPDWSEDEGRALSDAVGKPFAGSGFDGTPLSIIMGFKRQAEVYAKLPSDARRVLRALKLLYAAGLLSKVAQPTRELLRKVAVQILGVNDFHSSLKRVTDAGLAYVEDGAVFAYEGTLEKVVKDFPNDTDERWLLIGLLPEIFTTRAESPFAFNAGVSSYLSGYVELAATFWSKAIEIDPTYAKAYYNRGVARGEQGDHDGAIADCNKAIEIDPSNAKAYCNRGVARGEQGDHDGEMADYNKAIEIDPTYAKVYYNRGVARGEQGDHDGEIADYDKAIEIDPTYAKAYYNRGVARGKQGDHDGEMADYNKAIEIDPEIAHEE